MAGYNNDPNANTNNFYFQSDADYVNFDQFIDQYYQSSMFYPTTMADQGTFNAAAGTLGYGTIVEEQQSFQQFREQPQLQQQAVVPQQSTSHFGLDDILQSSNLLPTANEFVPTVQVPQVPHIDVNNANSLPNIEELNVSEAQQPRPQGVIKKRFGSNSGNNRTSSDSYDQQNIWRDNRNGSHRQSDDWRKSDQYENRRSGSGRTASQHEDRQYGKQYQNYSTRFNEDRGGDKDRNEKVRSHRDRPADSDQRNYRDRNDRDWKDRDRKYPNNRNRGNERHRTDRNYENRAVDDQKNGPNRGNNEPDFSFSTSKHPDFKANRNLKINHYESTSNGQTSQQCSQREKLIREIESGKLECLVCCEIIKPFQSVWSCGNCFHIIHLNCVIKWATSSKSDDGWRCPACQNTTKKVPNDYFCFCGKLKNPQYNRNDVAHSCGELCERVDGCEHPCRLLCHPGPCPSCQVTVTRQCGCGRSRKSMQCCLKEELECEEICDKLINCFQHKCTQKCHIGKCTDCTENVEHKCYCGRDTKEVVCAEETNIHKQYSCGKVCNRTLACKNHACKEICHDGPCGECKLLPDSVTSCPCGKAPILSGQRRACFDPVPLCQAICSKPLKCGPPSNPHLCTNKCHNGNCSTCSKETAVKCRCGHMDQMVKCRQLLTRADDARCKKRCVKKRNCGKHKCNQECCIDIDHICPNQCNYNLSCGKHKCDQTCHKGRCRPCYRSSFDELYCECGAEVIYPPVPCGTKKPACEKPCSRSHPCDHTVQHKCHSAATCPPCMAFTTKYCFGKHEQRKTIPCSQEDFSCGLHCGKPLSCNAHKCIKPCHSGPCEQENEKCKQQCRTPRTMCSHNCNAPCHTGSCPDVPCRENVEVLCECGNRKQTRTCFDFSKEYRRIATAKLASTMEDMQRGNSVELADVLGPVKLSNNKTLECNEDCKVLERNRKLAIGLQIRNPDLSSKLQPKYSEFIRMWAKKDAQLVSMIHDKLTELVKLAKESKQKSRSHSFPTMNREKRQLVHEMCSMFGVESVAYDAEPNRNVVANATKETTWLPSMSIMEVLQRETGQRRIPVPSNNAWGLKR